MLIKRIVDIVFSLILIVITAPLMALAALLVKLDSHGPAIFKQTRVGEGGKPFTVYKVRTMVEEAEQMLPCLVDLGTLQEPVYKLYRDPRVTRIGKVLRTTSVDELPQLFNVLKGDMSLVGPRPEADKIVALYNENHRKRLQIKPGLTGLQQINCRGSRSMEERLEYDLHYIANRSFWMDTVILFKTILVVLKCKGAC
ncbi:MAG TPA: sugar transferase [Syntrophobacteraceae bacterium]|nr:sugar transferase [Syntrophobacteraceae bacterium]